MSNYLGSTRSNQSASITNETYSSPGEEEKPFGKQYPSNESKANSIDKVQRVHIKKDDPLPTSVASRIVGSENLLREVTEKLYVQICIIDYRL
jgi:hypothetical protein